MHETDFPEQKTSNRLKCNAVPNAGKILISIHFWARPLLLFFKVKRDSRIEHFLLMKIINYVVVGNFVRLFFKEVETENVVQSTLLIVNMFSAKK